MQHRGGFDHIDASRQIIEEALIHPTIFCKRSLPAIIALVIGLDPLPWTEPGHVLSDFDHDPHHVTPNDKGERQSCLEASATDLGSHGNHFDQDIFSSNGWHRKISILDSLRWTNLFNIRCLHRIFSSCEGDFRFIFEFVFVYLSPIGR